MLFNSEEKNMMLGAFTAGGLEAIFDGYFGYRLAQGVNVATTPTEPAYWLYTGFFTHWIPNISQLISWFGVPAALYYVGKKKGRGKLRNMGKGGLVFGVAELVSVTAYKVVAIGTGNLAPYRVIGVVR